MNEKKGQHGSQQRGGHEGGDHGERPRRRPLDHPGGETEAEDDEGQEVHPVEQDEEGEHLLGHRARAQPGPVKLPGHEAGRAGTRKQAARGEAGDRHPEGVAPVERGVGVLEDRVEEHDVGAQGSHLEAEENREPRKIGLTSAAEDVRHVGHLGENHHEHGRHEHQQHRGGQELASADRGTVSCPR